MDKHDCSNGLKWLSCLVFSVCWRKGFVWYQRPVAANAPVSLASALPCHSPSCPQVPRSCRICLGGLPPPVFENLPLHHRTIWAGRRTPEAIGLLTFTDATCLELWMQRKYIRSETQGFRLPVCARASFAGVSLLKVKRSEKLWNGRKSQ